MNRIHHAALLVSLGSLLFTLGPSALAATSVTENATVKAPPAPTITVSTAFGTGHLYGASTAPTTSTSDTSITFPAVTTSSATRTVNASDWVAVEANVSNATSSTTWTVYGTGTSLTDSGSGSIPASDVSVPGVDSSDWAGVAGGSGGNLSIGNTAGIDSVALSSTSTSLYHGLSASSQTFLAFRPSLTIPANTPAGSYTGTIDLTTAVN